MNFKLIIILFILNSVLLLAEKVVDVNPYLTDDVIKALDQTQEIVKNSEKNTNKNSIKLQIAAFSNPSNANNFVKKEQEHGFEMQVLNIKSKIKNKLLYKVIILCSSTADASIIVDSKQYNGAYILR